MGFGDFLGEVNKDLHHWGEHQLGPAIAGTAAALDEFGKNKLGPAVGEVGKALEDFGKNKLGPAVWEAGKSLDEFGKTHVGPSIDGTGKWIEEHSGETALIAASGLTFLAPSMISTPSSGSLVGDRVVLEL
jgi:hypothetical protein